MTIRAFLLGRVGPLGTAAALAFTIGGTVYALSTNRAWLLVLVLITVVLAWGMDIYRRENEIQSVRSIAKTETQKRELIEKKIGELPLDTLAEIQNAAEEALWFSAQGGLVRVISFLQRMKALAQCGSDFEVRQVEQTGGGLYFAVRVDATCAANLVVDDPFLLMSETGSGIVETIGLVFVHQVPEPYKNAVFFRLVAPYRQDIVDSIAALAKTRDLRGLKGYSVRTLADLDRYRDMDPHFAAIMLSALAPQTKRRIGVGGVQWKLK